MQTGCCCVLRVTQFRVACGPHILLRIAENFPIYNVEIRSALVNQGEKSYRLAANSE